jgi:hypothetical protein
MTDSTSSPAAAPPVRAIAAYLPQYHPVPENDEWWGPGFTEWTNVAAARKLYPGHYQPHIPGELGFYDLRVDETRVHQAQLARQYGIEAFCYWHYWFAGRRMLNLVFDTVLRSGVPNFPFCLAWANTSWNSTWDMAGANRRLIEQSYPGVDDFRRHFETVLPAFHDPRYVRVDGRPLFYVYRPTGLPDAAQFADLWRGWAADAGLPGLYLVGETRIFDRPFVPTQEGFDAAVTTYFPPRDRRWLYEPRFRTPDMVLTELTTRLRGLPRVFLYERWLEYLPWLMVGDEPSFPTVWTNWDNTPRMGRRGVVFHGMTPELLQAQVELALDLVWDRPPEHRLVFLRSWNEWAEGNHLEPDRKYGRGYLEAFAKAVAVKAAGGGRRVPSNRRTYESPKERQARTRHQGG